MFRFIDLNDPEIGQKLTVAMLNLKRQAADARETFKASRTAENALVLKTYVDVFEVLDSDYAELLRWEEHEKRFAEFE